MFSLLEPSAEVRKRRGVALFCGYLTEGVAILLAVLFGVLFPQKLPVTRQYVVAWLPSLAPPKPKPPVAQPVRKVPKVVVPKIQPLETPKLVLPQLAEIKPPKTPPVITPTPIPVPAPPPLLAEVTAPPKPKESRSGQDRTFRWGAAEGHHEAPAGTSADGRIWQSGGF